MTITAPELHPITVVSPWYHVDFIGPLHPPSTQGSCYNLTISNYFTKYVLAIQTERKCASEVVDVLFKALHKLRVTKFSYSLFQALPASCDNICNSADIYEIQQFPGYHVDGNPGK